MRAIATVITLFGFALIFVSVNNMSVGTYQPWLLLIASIVVAVGGYVLGIYSNKKKMDSTIRARMDSIYNKPDLKTSGIKIRLKAGDCELKDLGYYEDHLISTDYETQAFTALRDPMDNVRIVKNERVYLRYTTMYRGVERHFVSSACSCSKEEFKMLMDPDKELTIYIDRHQPTLYLFDLEI